MEKVDRCALSLKSITDKEKENATFFLEHLNRLELR